MGKGLRKEGGVLRGQRAVVVTGECLHCYADFHGLLGTFWYACFFTREETFVKKRAYYNCPEKGNRAVGRRNGQEWTDVKTATNHPKKVMRPGFHL